MDAQGLVTGGPGWMMEKGLSCWRSEERRQFARGKLRGGAPRRASVSGGSEIDVIAMKMDLVHAKRSISYSI